MLWLFRGTTGLRVLGRICVRSRPPLSRLASSLSTELPGPEKAPLIPSPHSHIRLRDYQEECIHSVLTNLREGRNRLGVSLATGSGKTVIFTQLVQHVQPEQATRTQTLILVHRKELVEQAAKHCRQTYPWKTIEIEMAKSHATGTADITIASIRSLLQTNRIQKFDPARFKLVLVDEAHHIVARTYREALEYFGLDKPSDDAPALVGVSATFSRFDGLKLGTAIDHIVYHKDYVDMIGEKWLAHAIFTTVKSQVDLSKIGDAPNGDFQTKQLSEAVNNDTTNNITVRTWLSRAAARKSTLVFCVDIDHAKALTDKFRERGVDARYITSKFTKDRRARELDAFRNQEYPVLINCGLFTEGTDIPQIDCVLLARPTRSKNLLVQMIGRGLRLYPEKESCHIIDMVGSVETGVSTTPTLFGLDPDEGLDETSVDEAKKKKDETGSSSMTGAGLPKPSPVAEDDVTVTFTDYDSVLDLIRRDSGEGHIRGISGNAWIRTRNDIYVLPAPLGKITITKVKSGLFAVNHYQSLSRTNRGQYTPFTRARTVAKSLEFEQAVRAADTLADRVLGSIFVSLRQPWRKKPASREQVDLLNQRLALETELQPEDITKGQATDMINKLKYGAKGQFKMLVASQRRSAREKAKKMKLEELKEMEQVKVGPLV